MELVNVAIKAVFIENIVLAFFLGMCSFLAVSKKIETAIGLGFAVVFVNGITAPVNWLINDLLLEDGALAWMG
ncbi:MAG: NADH:ubiquinone reductase (Na(+)-transporting) subunit E, partial [Leptospiraceae bacterium]|nr:NADH:ubiquinone reductase (Na(+)-transporting) subunit E [Leptospiraceae bacterium]